MRRVSSLLSKLRYYTNDARVGFDGVWEVLHSSVDTNTITLRGVTGLHETATITAVAGVDSALCLLCSSWRAFPRYPWPVGTDRSPTLTGRNGDRWGAVRVLFAVSPADHRNDDDGEEGGGR